MKKVLILLISLTVLSMQVINISEIEAKSNKTIYLTFDDGPSKYTPKVLNVLKKNKVKATFFVTGMNPKYYNYIKIAYKQGHKIGLHTYSHNYKKVYKSKKAYFNDLNKIQKLVVKQIGKKTDIIRFPGGSSNTISRHYKKGIMKTISKQVKKDGYQYFDWNVDSGDASGKLSVNKIYKNSISKKKEIILLMHDARGKENTVKALDKIIKYYKKKGYTFKTLSRDSYKVHHHINN